MKPRLLFLVFLAIACCVLLGPPSAQAQLATSPLLDAGIDLPAPSPTGVSLSSSAASASEGPPARQHYWREASGEFFCENQQHGIVALLNEDRMTVAQSHPEDTRSRFSMQTTSVGRGEAQRTRASIATNTSTSRVELTSHPGVREWWINSDRGLEHGWTLDAPPPGLSSQPIRIHVRVAGAQVEVLSERDALMRTHEGWEVRYSGLRAWDALGRRLLAHLEGHESGLQVLVDDTDAEYPLMIDPVLSATPIPLPSPVLGFFIATGAGDFNNDGYDDVVYGDTSMLAPCQGGQVGLWAGGPLGLNLVSTWSYSFSGGCIPGFGKSVAGEDLNGDGFLDIIVGHNGFQGVGAVFSFYGGATPPATPSWQVVGDSNASGLGWQVTSAGDVNGDGIGDLLVSDRSYNCAQGDGKVFLHLGNANGLSVSPDWTFCSDLWVSSLGYAISTAGDVNGDGFDDVIVGEPDHGMVAFQSLGRALVFHGSVAGLSMTPTWSFQGVVDFGTLGFSVTHAGDVNGDGFSDVLVGQKSPGITSGRAMLFLGSAQGLGSSPDWIEEMSEPSVRFSYSMTGLGDINGDGFDDVAIAAPYYTNQAPPAADHRVGRVHVYLGSTTGLGATPAWVTEGAQTGTVLGWTLSPAGDVNGDGLDELIIGTLGSQSLYMATGSPFRRGDGNGDGQVNVADPILILGNLFGADPIGCEDAADANDDGAVNIADAVFVLSYLFLPGQTPIPAPGATTCGPDPTTDPLDCAIHVSCP